MINNNIYYYYYYYYYYCYYNNTTTTTTTTTTNNNNNKIHELPFLKSEASKTYNPNASECPQKTGKNMKQRSVKSKRRTYKF